MDKTYPTIILTSRMYKWYPGMYVTATTGGGHVKGSYHYRGEAVDFGAGDGLAAHSAEDNYLKAQKITRWQAMEGLAQFWYDLSSMVSELEHAKQTGTAGWYVKNGKRVSWVRFGLDYRNHRTHVHVAQATEAQARMALWCTVQKRLNSKAGALLLVDGVPGAHTLAALKKFQAANHLTADGVPGTKTTGMLR